MVNLYNQQIMTLSRKIKIFAKQFGPWKPFRTAEPSIILLAPPLSSPLKKTVVLHHTTCAVWLLCYTILLVLFDCCATPYYVCCLIVVLHHTTCAVWLLCYTILRVLFDCFPSITTTAKCENIRVEVLKLKNETTSIFKTLHSIH